MKVIKRDGHIVDYCPEKIEKAINKANNEVQEEDRVTDIQIKNIIKYIESLKKKRMLVEDIQDIIEMRLMSLGKYALAKEYITYRYTRELVRKSNTTDLSIKELIDGENEYLNSENSDKNIKAVTVQRDYLAGITSTDITRRFLLPEDIVKAHDEGVIHFHDTDYFAQNALHNCSLINLEDMLQNGTCINGVMIEKPHTFLTAMTIATQLITTVASSQYGECTITLTHLAPFVRESYKRHLKKYEKRNLKKEDCEKYAKEDLTKEITDGVQTFQYQINSMVTTNGKSPFLSVCLYLDEIKEFKEELALIIEEFLRQRIKGVKNETGDYVIPSFPKLLYVLEEDNIKEDRKFYYLTKLAADCALKGANISYISKKIMKKIKIDKNQNGQCYPCMGSTMFLTPYIDSYENAKYYGRFNQGVVTINLVDIALSADKDMELFWRIMEDRLELCHRALQIRHKRLSKVTSDVAPILWQHGALARLGKGESIHELLHHGYSTISLGYAGLYECVKHMVGSYSNDKDFSLEILKKLNDKCVEWKKYEDIEYCVYDCSDRTINYKFVKCLRERFGRIKDITDKDYINNIKSDINSNMIDKLRLEIELYRNNSINYGKLETLDETLRLIDFIYDNVICVNFNVD